jgi:hypothetical protein
VELDEFLVRPRWVRFMVRLYSLIGGMALGAILVGCTAIASLSAPTHPATTETARPSPSPPSAVEGTWRPVWMAGVTTGLPAATSDHDLKFFARSWAASNGCNTDSAFYEVGPDGRFSTSEPVNDLLICVPTDPTLRQQARSELPLPTADRLSHAGFVRIGAKTLTFTDATGHQLAVFVRVG